MIWWKIYFRGLLTLFVITFLSLAYSFVSHGYIFDAIVVLAIMWAFLEKMVPLVREVLKLPLDGRVDRDQ